MATLKQLKSLETRLKKIASKYPHLAPKMRTLSREASGFKKKALHEMMVGYDVIARLKVLEGLFGESPGTFSRESPALGVSKANKKAEEIAQELGKRKQPLSPFFRHYWTSIKVPEGYDGLLAVTVHGPEASRVGKGALSGIGKSIQDVINEEFKGEKDGLFYQAGRDIREILMGVLFSADNAAIYKSKYSPVSDTLLKKTKNAFWNRVKYVYKQYMGHRKILKERMEQEGPAGAFPRPGESGTTPRGGPRRDVLKKQRDIRVSIAEQFVEDVIHQESSLGRKLYELLFTESDPRSQKIMTLWWNLARQNGLTVGRDARYYIDPPSKSYYHFVPKGWTNRRVSLNTVTALLFWHRREMEKLQNMDDWVARLARLARLERSPAHKETYEKAKKMRDNLVIDLKEKATGLSGDSGKANIVRKIYNLTRHRIEEMLQIDKNTGGMDIEKIQNSEIRKYVSMLWGALERKALQGYKSQLYTASKKKKRSESLLHKLHKMASGERKEKAREALYLMMLFSRS